MKPVPLVSVAFITYQHKKYVGEAIESILKQTFTDFELVIVDDGSTDGTAEVIESFKDERIVHIRQERRGPSGALNTAFLSSRGKYVAVMSGDDISFPERLETQLRNYQSGTIQFSHVKYIDETSATIEPPRWLRGSFNVPALSQAQILRRLFDGGNFLNAVTMFAESEIFKTDMLSTGIFHPLFLQLQDFEAWVRLVGKYPLVIHQEPTVHYRIRGNENLSFPGAAKLNRSEIEHFWAIKNIFTNVSDELFREAFSDKLQHPRFTGLVERRCEELFLYLGSTHRCVQLAGTELLRELWSDPKGVAVLESRYQFTLFEAYQKLGNFDIFGPKMPVVQQRVLRRVQNGFTKLRETVRRFHWRQAYEPS